MKKRKEGCCVREFIIKENDANQRVDKFIQKTMKTMPKSLMYKYIRNKKIKVNRKRCEISQRLVVGDTVQCYIAEEFFNDQACYDFLEVPSTLHIVYEDEHLLIVDKPKGLLAHRDTQDMQDNLADRILHYLYDTKVYDPKQEQSFTPALCHRIDRNTQGIVMAAKTSQALREMNAHIAAHEVIKKYVCICEGRFKKKEATLTHYHRKGEDNTVHIVDEPTLGYKPVSLRYRILDQGVRYALVEVELISGKSHQIRAMMSHEGHPLVGDVKYGAKKDDRKGYQELCAYEVEFHFQGEGVLQKLNGSIFTLEQVDVIHRYYQQYRQ